MPTTKRLSMPRKGSDKKPLFLHQTGQWAKKIKGRMYYFGKDFDDALKRYVDERDEIAAGRNPRKHERRSSHADRVTLGDVVNAFLAFKERQVAERELSQRTFGDYYGTCLRLVDHFGKQIDVETHNGA